MSRTAAVARGATTELSLLGAASRVASAARASVAALTLDTLASRVAAVARAVTTALSLEASSESDGHELDVQTDATIRLAKQWVKTWAFTRE